MYLMFGSIISGEVHSSKINYTKVLNFSFFQAVQMFWVEELSVSHQSGPSRPGLCGPGGSGPPPPLSAAGSKGNPAKGKRREVSRCLASRSR